jgi:hypothetical protein
LTLLFLILPSIHLKNSIFVEEDATQKAKDVKESVSQKMEQAKERGEQMGLLN